MATRKTTKASPMPTPATAKANTPAPQPQPAPVAVALRGGAAVTSVKLTGKPYRVAAQHNQLWWQQCVKYVQDGGGAASVATMLASPTNPQGVPGHFLGYVIRRGYLEAV